MVKQREYSNSAWLDEENTSYVEIIIKEQKTKFIIQDGVSNIILTPDEAKALRDFLNSIEELK